MRLGSAELNLISDGTFRMDGGTIYGVVPKAIWGQLQPSDRKNRIEVARLRAGAAEWDEGEVPKPKRRRKRKA